MKAIRSLFCKVQRVVLVSFAALGMSLLLSTSVFGAANDIEVVTLQDTNGNGEIDRAVVQVDNPGAVTAAVHDTTGWTVTLDGNAITVDAVAFDGNADDDPLLINVDLDEDDADLVVRTSTAGFIVTYAAPGGDDTGVEFDDANNTDLTDFTFNDDGDGADGTLTDGAEPVFVSAEYEDDAQGSIESIRVTFSEDIAAGNNPIAAFDISEINPNFAFDGIASTAIIGGIVSLNLDNPTANVTGDLAVFQIRLAAQSAELDDAAGNQAATFAFQDIADGAEPYVATATALGDNVYQLTATESIDLDPNADKPTVNITHVDGEILGVPVEITDANITNCGDADAKTFCFTYENANATNFTVEITVLKDLAAVANTNNTPRSFTINIPEIVENNNDGGGGGGGSPLNPCALNPAAPGCNNEVKNPCGPNGDQGPCAEDPEQDDCSDNPDAPECQPDNSDEVKNPCGPNGDQCNDQELQDFCENNDDCVKIPGGQFQQNNPGNGDEPFKDVPEDHPLHDEVVRLFEMGVVEGRGEDTYAPDMGLTRAEVATLAVRLFNIPMKEFPSDVYKANLELSNSELVAKFNEELGTDLPGTRLLLNDIVDHPLKDYVWSAYQYDADLYDFGVVRGYTGELDERGLVPYKPDDIVSRAEAVQILQRAAIQWGGTFVVDRVPREYVEGPTVDLLQTVLAGKGLSIDSEKLDSVNPLERYPDVVPFAWYHQELRLTNFTMAYSGTTVASYVDENGEVQADYQIRILDGRQAGDGVVYSPDADVTRAEAAKIILGIWDLLRSQQQARA